MTTGSDASGTWPEGHEEEHCGCDYCTHPSWCGSDEHHGEVHDGEEQAPDWPCPIVLAFTGDPTREAFFEREAAEWLAWAEKDHPEWFVGATAPSADERTQPNHLEVPGRTMADDAAEHDRDVP